MKTMEENKQENNSQKKIKAVLKELSEYIILFVVDTAVPALPHNKTNGDLKIPNHEYFTGA